MALIACVPELHCLAFKLVGCPINLLSLFVCVASHVLLHSVLCSVYINTFCFFFFFFFAFCFQMLKTQEVIRRRHKNESNLFSSKRLIGSILLSCLDEGIQSYFLLDICFITLMHHCQAFKQVPSIFSRKIFMKNCFLRVILG